MNKIEVKLLSAFGTNVTHGNMVKGQSLPNAGLLRIVLFGCISTTSEMSIIVDHTSPRAHVAKFFR